MSEVKRYAVIPDYVYGHDKFGPVCAESEEPHFVLASHYDDAQVELAALREELAATEEALRKASAGLVEWRVLMMNAEQRNALVESLLRESLEEDDGTSDWLDRVIAALRDKPTESGASE